jgi:putative membrane protein
MTLAALQGIYCGPAPDPSGLWSSWNLDPVLLVALCAAAFVVRRRPAALAGVAVLAVTFVSPLCALSAALFSARVVHHVLLVAVAAPLLAVGLGQRQARSPVLPLVVATAVLWLWHLPQAYDLALSNVAVYWVMQLSLLASAVAFWTRVLHPAQAPHAAILATLGAYVQMALLGALLTFAPEGLYALHTTAPMAFGLSQLADQQLGGLIMWIPAGLPFLVIIARLGQRGWRRMDGLA